MSKPPPSEDYSYVPPPSSFLFCAIFLGASGARSRCLTGSEPDALNVLIVAAGITLTVLHLWLWRRQARAFEVWRRAE